MERAVTMRGNEPAQGKPMAGIRPRGRVRSLRVGQGRAVTTWDAEADVCWLLAYHWFHQNGHSEDCYNIFLDLHNNGDRLLPSVDDYEAFFESSDADAEDDLEGALTLSLLERLQIVSAELLEEARANPRVEAVRTFNVNGRQIMLVDALVEADGKAEEGWMSLRLPEDEHLNDSDIYELIATLLPEGVYPIYEDKFQQRERMAGEVVYRWEHWE